MQISAKELKEKLEGVGYCTNNQIVYSLWSAIMTERPLLVEGAPGIGKSSLAKALADALGLKFIQLHCYDGLTSDQTMYSYNYSLQLLALEGVKEKLAQETSGLNAADSVRHIAQAIDFFGPDFILRRPLLESITSDSKCVLLIDELDKQNDESLEHQLLELLDTYSMSIPEYKTIQCAPENHPIVIITSNAYKELSGALRRRCCYLYLEQKSQEEIVRILQTRAKIDDVLANGIALSYLSIQGGTVRHMPSIAELIEYSKLLQTQELSKELVVNTLGLLIKDRRDAGVITKAFENLPQAVIEGRGV